MATITGSIGQEQIQGTDFFDVVTFAASEAPLWADLAARIVRIEGRTLTLASIEGIIGGQGDDTLFGDERWNTLAGGAGSDWLRAFGEGDRLEASLGDDTLDGGAGSDYVTFASINLPLLYDLGLHRVSGEGLSTLLIDIEQIYPGSGNDRVVGTDADDILRGGGGDDTLIGGDGNDTFEGGPGADLMIGGAGRDFFFSISDGDTIDGGEGYDIALLNYDGAGFGGGSTYTIDLRDHTLRVDGRLVPLTLIGIEDIGVSTDSSLWIGDDGPNRLVGTTVIGGGGDDTLMASVYDYSAETAAIRVEITRFVNAAAFDGQTDQLARAGTVRLGSGDDRVVDGLSEDFWAFLTEGIGVWNFDGGPGDDSLAGGSLTGGAGSDTLRGDWAGYAEAPGPVWVSLEEGRAEGADGSDRLIGVQSVVGSAFDDTLIGNAADNSLTGGKGDDVIEGGAGNDQLVGGPGADTLVGGSGNDRFSAAGAGLADGGDGYDRLSLHGVGGAVTLDARAGQVLGLAGGILDIAGFEHFSVFSASSVLVLGSEASEAQRGLTVHLADAPMTVQGGAGIDTVETWVSRSALVISRVDDGGVLLDGSSSGWSGIDAYRLIEVERVLFGDECLAFGRRALDVAEVAFALWSPAIAASSALFGRGIDWYDDTGASRDALVAAALGFFAHLSDGQLAEQLATNVPGSKSAAELFALAGAHGGGDEGRAYIAALMAADPVNLAAVRDAGFERDGIVCARWWGSEALFTPPG